MLPRSIKWQDMYPGYQTAGVDQSQPSTTIGASSPTLAMGQSAPVMVIVAIIVLLVVVRVVYEMAPTGGKGV